MSPTQDVSDQHSSVTTTTATVNDDDEDPPPGDEAAGWFAMSALRIGLALIGLVVLLVALGQIAGVDFIGMLADVLATSIGRWIAVAVLALVIISFAIHGFGRWYR
jgi:hypothetical protein